MTGLFVGTFGYALVVLRVVHEPNPSKDAFVPTASISVAILLGHLSLVVVLVFFHHMVRTVQVAEIAADIARGTPAPFDRLYPERSGTAVKGDPRGRPRCVAISGETARRRRIAAGFAQRVAIDDLPAAGRRRRSHPHRGRPADCVMRPTQL